MKMDKKVFKDKAVLRLMEPRGFIESKAKELELSDIVEINYRPLLNDVEDTIPVVGYLSRKYEGDGKLYLKSTNPRWNPGRWGERGYEIKRIEYLRKLSPLGKKERFVKCLI